jgi:N-methylhydantoinase A
MHPEEQRQTASDVSIGADVGGTFTDLVSWDGRELRVVKVRSTPPNFQDAVVEATRRAIEPSLRSKRGAARMVHGSTVATNALLQRAGEPVAFVTTEGLRDMLLIGRQNRPKLYALRVQRAAPITPSENWFTVRERIDARGRIVEPLEPERVEDLIFQISNRGLRHVAVCLLFSFANPTHERMIGGRCAAAGLDVSLSSELLPEFREYERASTTAINASLRPVVATYLRSLETRLPTGVHDLRIMQSGGGTLDTETAATQAARLVLSGPAGGVIGAAFVARLAGFEDVITYDMGGTSTDVALVRDGKPQWTTATTFDGLPIGLPMFDIHSIGAGGGSIAHVDTGGALRVGPRSAGATPGPACYARGGTDPTVTDANVVLGRILPQHFLGGTMTLDVARAHIAVRAVAERIGKSVIEAALGIVRVAEANMAHAVRAVSSRRGHDPRRFALVSFGGAGGLHACALAEALEMSRVIVPPYCGVLSALGMVVAPPVADASRTVVQLGDALDDDRLAAEFGALSELTMRQVPYDQTERTEAYADARFRGQSHELMVRAPRPGRAAIEQAFHDEYRRAYGRIPQGRAVEIVTLRVRRVGHPPGVTLPHSPDSTSLVDTFAELVDDEGATIRAAAVSRGTLRRSAQPRSGPVLIIDPEATTFVPPDWRVSVADHGTLILERRG